MKTLFESKKNLLPYKPLETSGAKNRRVKEEFFENYCQGRGIDIGYGGDLLSDNCIGWDKEDGDAHFLTGVPDLQFDFVYSSHLLEHLSHPDIALRSWWRILKPGGYLIIYIPHRDLYEQRKSLPSRWNKDHKHFFLLDKNENPDNIGIVPLIQQVLSN